jgi:hypothetical protein
MYLWSSDNSARAPMVDAIRPFFRTDRTLTALLAHDAEIMLGMLVTVLGLDGVSAPRRIFGHIGVPLVILTCVLDGMAHITKWMDARWPLVGRAIALWSRAVIAAVRPKRLSRRALFQDDLR